METQQGNDIVPSGSYCLNIWA